MTYSPHISLKFFFLFPRCILDFILALFEDDQIPRGSDNLSSSSVCTSSSKEEANLGRKDPEKRERQPILVIGLIQDNLFGFVDLML